MMNIHKKNQNIKNNDNEKDYESFVDNYIIPKKISFLLNGKALFFNINPTINKVFIYNEDDDLLILNCQLFNEIDYKFYSFTKYNNIENSNILYSEEDSIYQIKYSFSSFDNEIYCFNDKSNYHTYYYEKINYYLNRKKIIKEYDENKSRNIKFITCRHIDFSFKIYLEKNSKQKKNNKQKEKQIKIYSFICEDFVTSCCCLSSNTFVIGLNNGKLIYYVLKENQIINCDDKKKVEPETEIIINKEIYIQAHQGKINTIDTDKKLGIIVTSGDDNYILARKIYDFELLLAIKLKSKYKILMTKISSYNFLYILCFNKQKRRKIILGYTLSGIQFAKSEYGAYDNISFTKGGNIITVNEEKELNILSGSDLTKLNDLENEEILNSFKEIKQTNWLQFDQLIREKYKDYNEAITFLENKDGNNKINVININNL